MSDKELTDEKRYVGARLTMDVWQELETIRKARRWTWQVLLEEIIMSFLEAHRRRVASGGK